VSDPARLPAGAGLCGHCRNARAVESRRGSRFVLCDLSRTNSRYPRYPPLPVLRCDGFEKLDGTPPTDLPNH
jgi:hypothetical protein